MWTELLALIFLLLALAQFLTQKRTPKFPPGPTGIPGLGYLPFLKLPPYKGILEISKKYGNICSIFFGNYPIVMLNDINIIKETFRDERFTGRPPLRIFKDRSFGAQRGIIFADGQLWSEQRRFALKNLRDFGFGKGSMEALIRDEVHDLVEFLKQNTDHPVSIQHRINSAVLNALWHIISGERYPQDDPKLQEMIQLLIAEFEETKVNGPLFFFPWITHVFPEWSGWNQFLRTFQKVYDFFQATVDQHKKQLDPDHPNDLIDVYLNEINATKEATSSFYKAEGDKNLLVVLLDLFAAGADTTSTTLGFAILYLITFPEIQRKAQQEIDNQIGQERMPCLADRQRLPYMEALISETLRFSSITPFGGIRSTSEPVDFHGYVLPKHSICLANVWAIHHDPEHWGDPDIFRPERFIGPNGSFQKDDHLIPFSVGKRACLGEGLARDELFLFLTSMLQQLNFEMNPNEPPPTLEPKQSTILHAMPYKVVMKLRKVK